METKTINTFSFEELLIFVESSNNALKGLQTASLGAFGIIKTTIYLLNQLSDIEENGSNLASFKKASNLLLQAFIKPLIKECSISSETAQETLKNEANSRLLGKWWMVYLSILSDTYKTHKSQPNFQATTTNIWFTEEEGKLLIESYELLENYYQAKITLLRFCFSRQSFLQEVGCSFTKFLSDQGKENIRDYFTSIIKSELEGINKNKKQNKDKVVMFRKKMLKQLSKTIEMCLDDNYSWSSILSGHISKKNSKSPLTHSVICGDDGGLYVLMNSIDDGEREMILKNGEIQEKYLEFCEKNHKKTPNSHQIVIGQGAFGKIRIAIALTKSETSTLMEIGQIVCVKKTSYFKEGFSWNSIRERSWSDYSVGDVANLIFSPPVYDMTIIQPVQPIEEKHQKGYTIQKFLPVYNGAKDFYNKNCNYRGQWEHLRSYLIEIFAVVSKLMNMGICMTDIKPDNTLYNGEKFKAVVIDLAGVVRKTNRSKLVDIRFKNITECSPSWSAPEIIKRKDIIDLTLSMSYSLGLFLKKLNFEAQNNKYKVPLDELAQKMIKEEPKDRISVEQGLDILRGIGREELTKNIEFEPFIVKLKQMTLDSPMKFGLNANIENIQKCLIPLKVAAVDPLKYKVGDEQFTFLKNDIDDFIYSQLTVKEKVFVLLGSSGSGKSIILQISYLEYLTKWKKGDPIPIFINLSIEEELSIQWKWVCKLLEKDLNFNLFSGYHYPLLLFIDSFDEVASKINFVTKFFDDAGNNPNNKCIICCRSDYIQRDSDYVKFFQPQYSDNKEIKKKFIAPLKENSSLMEYLERYYQVWNSNQLELQILDLEHFIKVIKQKNLNPIMKTVYMVHLTLEVLPQIINSNVEAPVTRSRIFEYYINKKIEKVVKETQNLIMSKFNDEKQDFHQIIQKSAFLLAKILHIEESTKTDNGKLMGKSFFSKYLFDPKIPCDHNYVLAGIIRALDLTMEIRGTIPYENISIGFSHDSMKNYFLTQAIYEESLLDKSEGILSTKLVVKDKVLIGFLAELASEKKEFKEKLVKLVYKSREKGESKAIGASNAITILIAANVSLAGYDLRGIRIKEANLRDGVFSGTNFSDADLTGVILENCKLDGATFLRTIMKDIKLGIFPEIKTEFKVMSCCISADGNNIAAGGENGNLKLWDRTSGNLLKIFKGHSNIINSVAFSFDGIFILSGSGDNTIKLWDHFSGNLIKTLEGHNSSVNSVTFSLDKVYILSGSNDKTIKLWDRFSGNLLKTFDGHNHAISSVSFSPNTVLILSGSLDFTIKLWDRASGNLLKTFEGHANSVNSVNFSPDGAFILSGSWDKTVKLWDSVSGELIKTFVEHNSYVTSVTFSPDGAFILSGSWDKTIKLWDRASGNLLKTFEGHTSDVFSVTFSPDGAFILSGSDDKTIKIWDRASVNVLKTFEGHSDSINSVIFSSDGAFILSGSRDRNIKLWDRASGNLLKTFGGHSNDITSVDFSRDNLFILSGSCDKTIKLWDRCSGNLIKTFEGHQNFVYSVTFSLDVTFILSGSGDNTIKLWDRASGNLLKTYEGHSKSVNSVNFSPDAASLLSGSNDKTIKLWDRYSGNLIKTFEGHSSYVTSVIFSPNGALILSGSWDFTIKLWHRVSGELIKKYVGHSSYVTSVSFSPDGAFLLSGSWDNTIKLWDTASGNLLKTFEGHSIYVNSVNFSPDGAYILSGSLDNTIKLWDRASGNLLKTFQECSYYVTSVAFSPDGAFILNGSWHKTVKLWDRVSGNLLKTFEGHSSDVFSVAFSRDGIFILSGSADKTIKLWDRTSGNILKTFEGHSKSINSVAFSFDGKFILSGSDDKTIKLWDRSSGNLLKTFEGHSNSVNSVTFSPDDAFILSGSCDNTIKLWDRVSGKLIKIIEELGMDVNSVAFSPNAAFILAGTGDKKIKLWDQVSGKLLKIFEGHSSSVNSVNFSPDGELFLSGSSDKTIKLWSLASGKLLKTFEGHISIVTSVSFSPDGAFILSGSCDKTIKLWDRASGKLLKALENCTSFAEIPKLLTSCFKHSVGSIDFLCSLIISPSETPISCFQLLICDNIHLSKNDLQVFLDKGGIDLNCNLFKPIISEVFSVANAPLLRIENENVIKVPPIEKGKKKFKIKCGRGRLCIIF